MVEEKLEIYEELLTTCFKCDKKELNKIFILLRATRLNYGKKMVQKSIQDLFEMGNFYNGLNDAYYVVLTNIVSELINLEELDGRSYAVLVDANYNDPNARFTIDDFRDLPVSPEKVKVVTQKINKFLDLLNH